MSRRGTTTTVLPTRPQRFPRVSTTGNTTNKGRGRTGPTSGLFAFRGVALPSRIRVESVVEWGAVFMGLVILLCVVRGVICVEGVALLHFSKGVLGGV